MKAKVKTKSNYKGLNGQWLDVKEISGTRVTCVINDEQAHNGKLSIDFTLSEVIEFSNIKF